MAALRNPKNVAASMKVTRYYSTLLTAVGLIGLSSCATRDSIRRALPAEARFDHEAGRGGYLRLKLHLESGEELKCMLDTGSPVTLLERALEPKLGKRLHTYNWVSSMGLTGTNGAYLAPKLYLGDTPLLTRPRMLTEDLGGDSVRLGMDILRHYCIQLDFTANKIRFLDPDALNTNGLGQAFPFTFSKRRPVIVHADFLGGRNWMIDTGTPMDVVVTAQHFDQASRDQQLVPFVTKLNDTLSKGALLPKAVFRGHTYSNVFIARLPQNFTGIPDILGLNFLARNLVTFNFPRGRMYLKPVTEEPLDSGNYLPLEAKTFLESMDEEGRLPGWSKNKGEIDWTPNTDDSETYPVSLKFKFQVGGWVDATPKIRSLAAVHARAIPVNNRLAGCDPAPYILKRLRVEFRRNGGQQMAETMEGDTLALPAGAEVVSARYGNLQGQSADPGREKGDISVYHYTVVRESKASPWTLQRAWQTDQNNHVIEEYPVP